MRRALRIYPLFILTLLTYYICTKFGHTIWPFDAHDLLFNILLLDGVGVFWAIPVEFQYYFFIPLISFLLLKYLDNFITVSVISLFVVVFYFSSVAHEYKPNILPFFAVFYTGSYLAYAQKKFEQLTLSTTKNRQVSFYLNFLCIISLSLFIMFVPKFWGYITVSAIPIGYFHHQFVLFSVLAAFLIFTAVNSYGIANKIISSRLFCFVGKISFSLYLGHYIVIATISKYSQLFSSRVSFLLILLISITLAYISFRVIEKPLFDLRHRIIIK